jgi:hypothetical protein
VDRYLLPAYPDLTFCFDVDPDPEADRDPSSSFGKSDFFFFLLHRSDSLHFFVFLVDRILKFSGKKQSFDLLLVEKWQRIQIRPNDADPSESGSTTLLRRTY